MKRGFSIAAFSLVFLTQVCGCLRGAGAARPSPDNGLHTQLIRLKAQAEDIDPSGDMQKLDAQWAKLDSVISRMSADGAINYRNQLLIPDWDLGGKGLGLVRVNAYHPRVEVRDLNDDARLDLVISARESGRILSPYYFLVYLNTGEKLRLALQLRTRIANDENPGRSGHTFVWNGQRGAYNFSTRTSTIVDYHARKCETQALVFTLGADGRYQRVE